jgi:hypothetical protein
MIPRLRWQKSSFSEGGSENCVEVGTGLAGHLHLRESDTPGIVIPTAAAALAALFGVVKSGAVPRS